jgi:hypothetical protein
MATVPRGSILRRVHYGWRCSGATSTLYSVPDLMDTLIAVGACVGYPDTTYAVPNAFTAPNDTGDPMKRWIWWEVRQLRPVTWGSREDDVATWMDDGPVQPTDTHAPVTASTPAGQNLGVYLSWAPTRTDFPGAGYIQVAMWWSLLYST